MALKLEYKPYTLKFKFDAGTSRGVLKEKETWFLKVYDDQIPDKLGYGECGPIAGLSVEDLSQMPFVLDRLSHKLEKHRILYSDQEVLDLAKELVDDEFPSV